MHSLQYCKELYVLYAFLVNDKLHEQNEVHSANGCGWTSIIIMSRVIIVVDLLSNSTSHILQQLVPNTGFQLLQKVW